MIYGSLTSYDLALTLPTRTFYVMEHERAWVGTTLYRGLAGNWNQDEESSKLHSIPDLRKRVPVLGVCVAGKDQIGLQSKEVDYTK